IADRRLSRRVASGAKRGFTIPVHRWLAGPWREAVEESFRNSILAREGWVRADAVLAEVRRAADRGHASNHLWYCYVLESWLRQQRRAREPVAARLSA